jgi:hypothetical protein
MMNTPQNWVTVTESQYLWEREALAFVRDRFPNHEPYRAWSNFEFIADDGSINEVDLLGRVCKLASYNHKSVAAISHMAR